MHADSWSKAVRVFVFYESHSLGFHRFLMRPTAGLPPLIIKKVSQVENSCSNWQNEICFKVSRVANFVPCRILCLIYFLLFWKISRHPNKLLKSLSWRKFWTYLACKQIYFYVSLVRTFTGIWKLKYFSFRLLQQSHTRRHQATPVLVASESLVQAINAAQSKQLVSIR